MRIIVFCFIILIAACTGPKQTINTPNPLDGDWVPQRQEIGGRALPPAAFAGQLLTMHDSSYTLVAESIDKGVARINGNKMDIYGREGVNKGKHFSALYQLLNGELTICYNLAGTGYPDSLSTRGKPLYFLSVFRKK